MNEQKGDLGSPIALGRTAELYSWGERQVLKLFRDGWPGEWVEGEARLARLVLASGLSAPAVGELVKLHDRLGLVYERLEGPSLLRDMSSKPWRLLPAARLLAELHAGIHERLAPQFPAQRQSLASKIQRGTGLSLADREAALELLDRLPDGERLCHGDFHPDNILMTSRGPVIIDWMNAAFGNPLADVARTSLLIQVGTPASGRAVRWLLLFGRRWFHQVYLDRYFQLRPDGREQLDAWLALNAAARLAEGIAEEQERLVAIVREHLASGILT